MTSERVAMETVDEIERALRQRLTLTEYLLSTEPWEFAMVVLEAPDRLQHLFWKKLKPTSGESPEKRRLLQIYSEMDEGMRRLVQAAEQSGPVVVVVVSDHGFQALDWNLFINNHLIRQVVGSKARPSLARVAAHCQRPIRRARARAAGRVAPGMRPGACRRGDRLGIERRRSRVACSSRACT